ncbi:MAG: [FeFe] hydrogenase, group A [Clostridiales Family XIII bacterium]|jgi:NADP-reducing hydrogenase subunit HndD|nr:[FeFe] hydrogenase, group A [Clostridiales Family XIII bacterium]
METISIKFDGKDYAARRGSTILAVALESQKLPASFMRVDIPAPYYYKGINDIDESGVCVVEVDGKLVNASNTRIKPGMEVATRSEAVTAARKEALSKILAIHDKDCTSCFRTDNCEFQELLYQYGFTDEAWLPSEEKVALDTSSRVLVRDNNKCIRCRRCVNVCTKIQSVSAIECTGEGLEAVIAPASPSGLDAASCVNCGQCVAVCPVGALFEKDESQDVLAAIADSEKFVIAQVAPAVRATLGEAFEFPLGVDVEKRIPAALRELGFDKVFDAKFGADLTIMEEANEFMERMQNDGVLPMITSCCPGWIKYCEHFYPNMIENLSSCKSPHQMLGAIAKSYYAEQLGIDKENIVVVSIMPCTAKKYERQRDGESGAGVPDVDVVLTVRELARILEKAEVQIEAVPFEAFDAPFGLGTGAGVIFGASGGVMEAALRTAVEKLTKEELKSLEFSDVRGMSGIKEASYTAAGIEIKVAVVSGLGNANSLLQRVSSGEAYYDFIEVMACPGGCINGGGLPYPSAITRAQEDVRAKRASALYSSDTRSKIRKSHENPMIVQLYESYLGEPGSEKAEQLLHTFYAVR